MSSMVPTSIPRTDDLASRVSASATGTSGCQLSADVFLSPGSYSLAVIASLAGTSSTATAQVALGVTATVPCNASTPAMFSHALMLAALPENPATPQTILPAAQLAAGARCSFTSAVDPSLYRDWVTVDEATGEVSVKDLDYEKVTSLVISLSVTCDTQQQQLRTSRDLFSKDQPNWPRELLYDVTSMSILLQIEDLNDNDPVFTAGDPLVVGYPTGGLLERVQPGPVVTLTATDADDGENAALRYRLDAAGSQRFTVQEETGAVYLRADAADLPAEGVEFTATVLDLAGAQGARSDSMQVQVKPLDREELVLVMMVEGALPEDTETVVETLGGATGLAVRLLRAHATAAEGSNSHARALVSGAARADTGAALTLMLYALDDQGTPINVEQFQKLLSSSEVELPWEVSKVENLPPEAENQGPIDVTGYMAAIITLAVLIALALVGVGAGYYFYIRPRMGIQKQKGGYTEFTSGADKPSPLESQIPQTNISTAIDIIEPVNNLTIENNISKLENSNGVLAPGLDDDWPRKRSVNIRESPDDYDGEAHTVARKSESSDSIDADEAQAESDQRKSSLDEDEARAEAERRKSTVHFNENVECIEVDRL